MCLIIIEIEAEQDVQLEIQFENPMECLEIEVILITHSSSMWKAEENVSVPRDWLLFFPVSPSPSKSTHSNLFLRRFYYFIFNNLFRMSHISQMERKLKKYVFHLLIDQLPSSEPHTQWTYLCKLCSMENVHRPTVYSHVEICHSTPIIVNYLLSLENKPAMHEIIQFFCKDQDNISMN